MTSTSFVFTELANTMKYGGGFLYNLVFTVWRHCVSQNEVWGMGCYITLFSPSDVIEFHRISPCQLLHAYDAENMLLVPRKFVIFSHWWLLHLSPEGDSQQAQVVESTLVYCWSSVSDAGSTLSQHCSNLFVFAGQPMCSITSRVAEGIP